MSLSEVLGATFSSLQTVQQDSSHPNLNVSSTTGIIPEPNAVPVQTPSTAVPQSLAYSPKCGSGDPQSIPIESCHSAAQPVMQRVGVGLHHYSQIQPTGASSVSVTSPVFVSDSIPLVHAGFYFLGDAAPLCAGGVTSNSAEGKEKTDPVFKGSPGHY